MGNGNDTQNNNTQIIITPRTIIRRTITPGTAILRAMVRGTIRIRKKGRLSGIGDGIRNGSAFRGFGKSALIA